MLLLTTIDNLRHCPQNSQYQQDAHEWRQLSQRVEYRYRAETANTKNENQLTLHLSDIANLSLAFVLWHLQFTLEVDLQHSSRYDESDERRDDDFCDNTSSSNHLTIPQHNGCHITDW